MRAYASGLIRRPAAHPNLVAAPALCALLLAAVVPTSEAQVVLQGRVLDDISGQSLVGARVLLLNRWNKVVGYSVTNEAGRFRFERRRPDMFRLEAQAIGYKETVTPLVWMTMDRDSTEMEVRLTRFAILLAPLEIVGMSAPRSSAVLDNVQHRRERGFGYHLTREDIEERGATHISDVIASLPGVHFGTGRTTAGGRPVYIGRALPGRPGGCPAQVYVDGLLANSGVDGTSVMIDNLVSPLDVEVIEVFKGLATVPPEFLNDAARCGVVAIWTRRGG